MQARDNDWWDFKCWAELNKMIYEQTLTDEHITKKGNSSYIEALTKVSDNGAVCKLGDAPIMRKCFFMEKGNKRYIIPEDYMSKLPFNPNPKKTFECYIKPGDTTIYNFVFDVIPLKISGAKTIPTFRQFMDSFNPQEVSNKKLNMFLKLQAVASRTKSCKYRLCGPSRCVDGDTEFLSDEGWKKISEYQAGDKVMQYNTNGGFANLVEPMKYIDEPCDEMYSIKSKTVDQVLSPEHKVLYKHPKRKTLQTKSAKEVVDMHERSKNGFYGTFINHFRLQPNSSLDISDDNLRVQVAVMADGTFDKQGKCVMRLKKEDKVNRIRMLLDDANILFDATQYKDNYWHIKFKAPIQTKTYDIRFWDCNQHQIDIIANECLYWDGNRKNEFYTTIKGDADFIQYCFTTQGYKTSIVTFDRRGQMRGKYERKSIDYIVHRCKCKTSSIVNGNKKNEIKKVVPINNRKYCFTVPTGYLVLRRNDKIFITGNCGKNAYDKVLGYVDNSVWITKSPSNAALYRAMCHKQKIILDEMANVKKDELAKIFDQVMEISDETPSLVKTTLQANNTLGSTEIGHKSLIMTYNRVQDLQKDQVFFDKKLPNPVAFNNRMVALLLGDNKFLDLRYNLSPTEAKDLMELNKHKMIEFAKNYLYYTDNPKDGLHNYTNNDLVFKTNTQHTNFQGVLNEIDRYCETQEEYDSWMRMISFMMEDYNLMVKKLDTIEQEAPAPFQKFEEIDMRGK